jgi:hypothetical protein
VRDMGKLIYIDEWRAKKKAEPNVVAVVHEIATYPPTKQDNTSLKLQTDLVFEAMKRDGAPVTRPNYLKAAYGEEDPQLEAEQESSLQEGLE